MSGPFDDSPDDFPNDFNKKNEDMIDFFALFNEQDQTDLLFYKNEKENPESNSALLFNSTTITEPSRNLSSDDFIEKNVKSFLTKKRLLPENKSSCGQNCGLDRSQSTFEEKKENNSSPQTTLTDEQKLFFKFICTCNVEKYKEVQENFIQLNVNDYISSVFPSLNKETIEKSFHKKYKCEGFSLSTATFQDFMEYITKYDFENFKRKKMYFFQK